MKKSHKKRGRERQFGGAKKFFRNTNILPILAKPSKLTLPIKVKNEGTLVPF
jgi:hypothetical protein